MASVKEFPLPGKESDFFRGANTERGGWDDFILKTSLLPVVFSGRLKTYSAWHYIGFLSERILV